MSARHSAPLIFRLCPSIMTVPPVVIAGLDPAIQLFSKKMDARVKTAHDELPVEPLWLLDRQWIGRRSHRAGDRDGRRDEHELVDLVGQAVLGEILEIEN